MSPPNDGGAYDETGSEKQHQQKEQQERDEAHLEANMAVLACGGSGSGSDERFMVGGTIPERPQHDQRLQDRTLDTLADVPSCQDDAAGPLPLQSGQQPHRYPMQQARPTTERHGGTATRRPQYDCSSSFANLSDNSIVQQQQRPHGQVSAATQHVLSACTQPAPGTDASSVLATATTTRPGTAGPPMAATIPSNSMPRPVLLPTLSAQSLSGSSIGSLQSPTCSDVDTVRSAAAAASTDNNMRMGPSSSSAAVQRRNRVRTHQVMTADSSSSSSRNAAASSSNTSKSTGGTTTTTGNIKLQPAASNRIRCSADMQLLRTRRRMWLEEQARQIAREERRLQDGGGSMSGNSSLRIAGVSASDLARAMVEDDPHRRSQRRHHDQREQRDAAGGGAALADELRRPSATADAAAQVANGMLGSPLPTPGSSGGVVFSGGDTATNHFHNRSVSIAGMVIPSPASDRFILNMPFGGGDIGGIGGGDDDGTVAQGLAEMAAMDGDNEDPGDVAYAADGIRGEATEFCMDEDSKEEEGTTDNDDDGSTATVLAEDDDQPVQGAAHRSMGQQRHYPSVPNLLPVKLPAIARRMSGGANYPISEDLVVPPRPRSSDPWLNSRRRFEAVDSRGPSTSQGDALPSLLEGGFVPPPRPHSSEPSFDAYVGGMGFQRKVVAAQHEVASGRIVFGPAPPPPPLYNSSDDVVEDDVSSSRPSSRSSSRPPSVLKQPLLNGEETPVNRKELLKGPMLRKDLSPTLQFDSIPPPPLQGEEQAGQLKTAGTEGGTDGRRFSTNRTLGGTLQISFADGKGVEISLPSHLSAAPSFDTLRTSANETIAASAPPSSRLANVPTFDRSASIIDRGAGTVFADSCSGTGQALFTPPNARSKVSFSAASRGNENTPPSCADTRSSDKMSTIPVTLPDLPHAPLSHQLPNITTFGRSASVGGHLLGSPESSTCRTPSNQVESSGQEDGVTKTGERLPSQQQRIPYRAWEPPFSQGPLPSLPLASPREEDEEEDTYEYAPPSGGGPGGRF